MMCKNVSSYKIILLALVMSIMLFMFGCNSPTENHSGNVAGSVFLTDDSIGSQYSPVNYSDVVVGIYKPVTIDTTLSRLNTDYPSIGVGVSQSTDFDHRYETPLLTTGCNEVGAFSFSGVPYGTYNLVISKPGWGWQYKTDICIDNTDIYEIGLFTLYPEIALPSYNSGLTVLLADHHYVATGNVYFNGIEFRSNSWLRLYDHINIVISSQYVCPTEGFAYVYNEFGKDPSTSTIQIIDLPNLSIHNMVYKQLYYGLNCASVTGEISNSRFIDCGSSMLVSNSSLQIDQITCTDNSVGGDCMGFEFSQISVQNSIVVGYLFALNLKSNSVGLIQNNFIRSLNPVRLDTDTFGQLYYNYLQSDNFAIFVKQAQGIDIKNNVLAGNKGVYLQTINISPDNIIRHNNFYCSSTYLETSLQMNQAYAGYFLNATMNYFNRVGIEQISQYVIDANDYNIIDRWALQFDLGQVSPTPFSDCGIQSAKLN